MPNADFTTAERDAARYMSLICEPVSSEAVELTGALAIKLWAVDANRRRERPGKPFTLAVGAIIADLLRTAALDPNRYCWREMSAGAFTGQRVKYHAFKTAYDALRSLGYVRVGQRGHRQTGGFDDALVPGNASPTSWTSATRFRATDKLLSIATARRVPLDEWDSHFRQLPMQDHVTRPIIRKAAKVNRNGKVLPAVAMRVDFSDPVVAKLREVVDTINLFMSKQSIEPSCFTGFRRIFSEGDKPTFDWNKGGRLYSIGDSYQQLPRIDRTKITFNGQLSREIDIRASHLTILAAHRGHPAYDKDIDPYKVHHLDREVVKAFVTMTLGHKAFHKRWPVRVVESLRGKLGPNPNVCHPLSELRGLILCYIPALKEWPTYPLDCFDIQFIESEIIIAATLELTALHGIPCLPVHDSIIVPKAQDAFACEVLSRIFMDRIGIVPVLR